MAQSLGRKPKLQRAVLHLVSYLVTEILYRRETHLHELMKLSEEGFNKCIYTLASLHCVDAATSLSVAVAGL